MNHYDDLDDEVRCQFCTKKSWSSDWKDGRCPECGRMYDDLLAQEGDD